MIKAKELRLGNLIQYSDDSGEVEVTELQTVYINEHFHESEYKGIPLTPELLLEKCGFMREADEFRFGKFFIRWTGGNEFLFRWQRRRETLPGTPATSFTLLHELQNLYFALTGEELTINL